jgi:hypothetical protein
MPCWASVVHTGASASQSRTFAALARTTRSLVLDKRMLFFTVRSS